MHHSTVNVESSSNHKQCLKQRKSGTFAGPCGKIRVRKQYVLFFRVEYVERSIPVQGVCQNDPLNLSDQATRNIGRPKVTISEDVLERRRLSKRRQNTRQTGQQVLQDQDPELVRIVVGCL
ncbi:hypothetical protein ACET3Z_001634 [Daucus carota]